MNREKILTITSEIFEKKALSKVAHLVGSIVVEVCKFVKTEDVLKMIEEIVEKEKQTKDPIEGYLSALEIVKTKWESLNENQQTKLLIILYIINKILNNSFTIMLFYCFFREVVEEINLNKT